MLTSLFIKNYALIEETNVEFAPNFVTITGETGAGKSILLGALGLIIGNRADSTVLRDKDAKCIVEASFDISKRGLNTFFFQHELDYEEHCIIRREILPGGKSRAFINDMPVQVSMLKELSEFLLDIHSQNETLQLKNEQFQIETLDLFAENDQHLANYRAKWSEYKKLNEELNQLIKEEVKIKSETDYLQFQYDELANANLITDEQEKLESELKIGENAEEIKSILNASIYELNDSESSILSKLNLLKNQWSKIQHIDSDLSDINTRITQTHIELKDLYNAIEDASAKIDFDPERKVIIEDRLDLIYSLQKKHQVKSVEELISIKESLESKLDVSANFDEHKIQLEKKINELLLKLNHDCIEIEKRRITASKNLCTDVQKTLAVLSIPDAQVNIKIEPTTDFNRYGKNKITYLFSANKGMLPEDISKIASGGEISRFMLSLKALISSKKNQPTIIFDEIDTGVSGTIADKLGQVMNRMGKYQQVISITHLPQIASKGNQHYKVVKSERNEKTISELVLLNNDERIQELATMLSGNEITNEAIENAKVMLKS